MRSGSRRYRILFLDLPDLLFRHIHRGKDEVATTYQAISGAGKTFKDWPEMVENVIPYIGGEEEKSEKEPADADPHTVLEVHIQFHLGTVLLFHYLNKLLRCAGQRKLLRKPLEIHRTEWVSELLQVLYVNSRIEYT